MCRSRACASPTSRSTRSSPRRRRASRPPMRRWPARRSVRAARLRDRARARAAARPARRRRRSRPTSSAHWLAGVTIVNDLSARDIQLPQGQFYKGKSFRGFGPVGPGLRAADARRMGALAGTAHAARGERPDAAGRVLPRDDPRPGRDAHRAGVAARPARRRPDRHRHAGRLRGARARAGSRCSSCATSSAMPRSGACSSARAARTRPTCDPATASAPRSAPTTARSTSGEQTTVITAA